MSNGEQWGAADEASLAGPPLTSCCAARFLTGCGPETVRGPGVGDPCLLEKEQTDKFNLVKVTNFCSLKDTIKTMKSHKPGKTLCKSCLIKDLYPEYIKTSQNAIIRKQPNFFNGQKI